MPDYDVAIVGAGFVGATLAIALGHYGLRVVVIDARSPLVEVGTEDARGIALSPSSRLIFEDIDLWSALATRAQRIEEINVSAMGGFASIDLRAREIGLEALAHVVPANHLLRSLENSLLEKTKVLWRTTLESLKPHTDFITISLVGHDDEHLEINARLLIGADGVNSKVRSLSNIGANVRAYNQQAIVANVSVDGSRQYRAFERFTPTGPIALLPSVDNRHVLVRCCRLEETESLLALSDQQYLDDIAQRFARPVGHFSNLGPRRSHPLVLAQSNGLVAERTVLVGAAAVTVHPNGAQGLNLALRDIAALCRHLVGEDGLAWRPHQSSFELDNRLQNFARDRHKDHRQVIRFTDGLARMFSSKLPGLGLFRGAGMLATKLLPSIQKKIIYQGVGAMTASRLPVRTG